MAKGDRASHASFSAAGFAAVFVLVAWCLPALASSGINVECNDALGPFDTPTISAAPSLAARTETSLKEILVTAPIKMPTLADTAADSGAEDLDDPEPGDEPPARNRETAPIITRLPGVSEAALPSFRHHMYRTDI